MKDDDLKAAALLFSQGRSLNEISDLLGCSASHASRLVKAAEEKCGFLRTTHHLALDDASLLQAERRVFSHRLATSGLTVRAAHVVAGPAEGFGRGAAVHLERLLRGAMLAHVAERSPAVPPTPWGRRLGVAWGRTLASVVAGLEAVFDFTPIHASYRRASSPGGTGTGDRLPEFTFFPVRGGFLMHPSSNQAPSRLVAELDRIVHGEAPLKSPRAPLTLDGIPAVVPRWDESALGRVGVTPTQARDVLEHYFERSSSYQAIVRGPDCLLETGDGLLLSIGPSLAVNDLTEEASAALGLDPREVAEKTHGDIAGCYIARPGYEEEVSRWSAPWVGLKREHLVGFAARGREEGRIGVVVFARGAEKALILRECLRQNLVNEIICDQELAQELGKLIARGSGT